MKRKIGFVLAFVLISLFNQAQQVGPNISWDVTTYDFGDIKETDGKVTYNFTFANTGSEPLVITNVRPSCGCTSSDYTKEPVTPGGKGFVSATFNPENRPGNFSKSITITTNCNPPTTNLRFTGNVISKPKTIDDEYPRLVGELRLKSNHLALAKVSYSEVKNGELEMVNTTNHDLEVTFRNVPNYIKIQAEPTVLKPGEKGLIKVSYDAKLRNDWGFIMDKVTMAINGNTDQNRNSISVSVTIEEDFSKLTPEQKANAPHIEFETKAHNFESLKQGQNIDFAFKFKNTGKSDLIIRKIKPSCGCTIVNPTKEVLKPGDAAEFKVNFNSSGKAGKQNKTITVITNDPLESQVTLRVTGDVLAPESK